ncbi:MAG: type I phosphomannose isomerase catalytic subunit [Saccharofermentanales bacterium]
MRNNNISLLYPIKMQPAFKDYIWGGDCLIKDFGKQCNYKTAAESWELSAHPNGQSTAVNGPLAGKPLSEIIEKFGKRSLGSDTAGKDRFPILIKFIDSRQNLSVQVHPDDEYALRNEGDYGKTEMWYVVQAIEGSGIFCGFKDDITKERFRESIADDSLTDLLNWIPVKKGDTFFITPGTVHAICEGVVIAEIQQNSDVTYRIYDYNRKGPDNKGRVLHIDKALDVSRLSKDEFDGKPLRQPVDIPGAKMTVLAECVYFNVKEYEISDEFEMTAGQESFQGLVFVEGNGVILYGETQIEFKRGDTFFIPADMGKYTIKGRSTALIAEV